MTWTLARHAVIDAIEGAAPTVNVRGKRAAFRHFAEAEADRMPDARGFFLRGTSTAQQGTWAALSDGTPRRYVTTADLVVCYFDDSDARALDEMIASDWFAIASRLAMPSSWTQATSSIHAVIMQAATIEREGARVLLTVPLEVHHQTISFAVSPANQSGTVGVAFSYVVPRTGNVAALSWSVATGTLPAGLTLDAGSGVISGTPTTDETQAITLQACYGSQCVTSSSFTIDVVQLSWTFTSSFETPPATEWQNPLRTANDTSAFTQYGTSEANAGLSSPLTDTGTNYLRTSWSYTLASESARQQFFPWPSDELVGTPSTRSIDVRAWVRVIDESTFVAGSLNGLAIKFPLAKPANYTLPTGYRLTLGRMAANRTFGSFALRLFAPAANTNDTQAVGSGTTQVTCTGTYVEDQWYRLRLTCESVGGDDVLVAYTGSGATDAETWTQVGTLTVPSTSTGFVAWSNGDRTCGPLVDIRYNASGAPITSTFRAGFDAFKGIVTVL